MNKTTRYLLCENPMKNEDSGLFIYSTRHNKRALVSVNQIDIEDIMRNPGSESGFTIYYESRSTGLPEFHEMKIFDNIDTPDHKIPVILKNIGKWYKNYLIWEEGQLSDQSKVEPILKDYNDKVRGLKIIHSSYNSKYMSIFRGKIMVFDSLEELFKWILENYKIEEGLMDEGFINEI